MHWGLLEPSHPFSSVQSPQSLSPSHLYSSEMQRPDAHNIVPDSQRGETGAAEKRERTSGLLPVFLTMLLSFLICLVVCLFVDLFVCFIPPFLSFLLSFLLSFFSSFQFMVQSKKLHSNVIEKKKTLTTRLFVGAVDAVHVPVTSPCQRDAALRIRATELALAACSGRCVCVCVCMCVCVRVCMCVCVCVCVYIYIYIYVYIYLHI